MVLHHEVQTTALAEITCPRSPRTEAGATILTSVDRATFFSILSLYSYWTSSLEGPGPLLWMSASTALLTLEELCQPSLAEDITIYYLGKEIHLQV